ncbi:MAG TPA: diguanylate cyclase [Nocardioides sp.]|nr:diguanylate cyclase [Nocardioides sp.]
MGLARTRQLWRAATHWVPHGGSLSPAAWRARHHGICLLLWFHVVALIATGLLLGQSLTHSVAESSVLAWLALGAGVERFGPTLRSALATLGLMTSSALVVHVSGGLIEAHFHFFVMVAVVALYQSWQPFGLALAFVVAHHALAGTVAPDAVYNHPAATSDPLLWGLLHGGFVLCESIACLIWWRSAEIAVEGERSTRRDLVQAQALAGIGSWEWDLASNTITWSDQLFEIAGADRATFVPSFEAFLDLVHPEDRDRVSRMVRSALQSRTDLDYECRLVRLDGTELVIHALGQPVLGAGHSLTSMRGTVHDVTERARMQSAMRSMAFEDPLTGLANRRAFSDRLQEMLAARHENTFAVLFIDLDDFKSINDTHGHAAGDAVLKEVAARLKRAVRGVDTVARVGGDEFTIICRDTVLDEARVTASRIESELSVPTLVDGRCLDVSASVGIAVPDADSSADMLLRAADSAMYAAKARRVRAGQG